MRKRARLDQEDVIRREVFRFWQARGWTLWAVPRTSWRAKAAEKDIYGCWDGLANKLGQPTMYVQWTTIRHISDHEQKIDTFLRKTGIDVHSVLMGWNKEKRQFRMIELIPGHGRFVSIVEAVSHEEVIPNVSIN